MKILTAAGREGRMREMTNSEIALVIISQNVREEFHMTLIEDNSGKFVDLRTYIRDQGTGNASPTSNGVTINLELWPQFIAALSTSRTWTDPLPFWGKQKPATSGRADLFFPKKYSRKNPQEQILLEHRNFRGILFIFLKTLARTGKGRGLSQVTIGPLLWSQFMQGLKKIEEVLLKLGWLSQENHRIKSESKMSLLRKEVLQPQTTRREYSDYMFRSI